MTTPHWLEELHVGDKVIVAAQVATIATVSRITKTQIVVKDHATIWRFLLTTGTQYGAGHGPRGCLVPYTEAAAATLQLEQWHARLSTALRTIQATNTMRALDLHQSRAFWYILTTLGLIPQPKEE